MLYESVPTEGDGPEPTVARITRQDTREVIWVKYTYTPPNSQDAVTRVASSQDGGISWQRDTNFLEDPSVKIQKASVIYEPNENGDLVSRSLDGGIHWIACLFDVDGLSAPQFASKIAQNNQASLAFNLAATNPRDAATIYGTFWVKIPDTYPKSVDVPGIYVSHDAGDHWFLFTLDAGGTNRIERTLLAIDPSDPGRMIGHGTSGLVLTIDGGKSWSPVGQQAELEAPAEIKGRREYVSNLKDKPWVRLYPKFAFLALQPVVYQRGNPNVIYLVTNKGLYKTEDSGRTWRLLYAGMPPSLYEVHSMLIDPSNSNRLFLNTRYTVLVSADGGCQFRTIFDWKRFAHD